MMDDKATKPDVGATVDRVAETIGLEIAAAHRPGVIANFERISGLAALVTAFPLPEDVEIAPVFVP
jgi:1-carboxybiuret hydrolase subunit AtzG-like